MSGLQTQMRHRDRDMVPKALVQGMFALMIASVAIVAFAQWTGAPNAGVLVEAPVVKERAVLLTGGRDMTFSVTDAATGAEIARSSDPRDGFIGVIGRVIERDRLVNRIEGNPPVRLVRRENGHTAIIDDSTGLVVELIGYGADNVAAFARLLD
jgi:putative photosynthetic complex assembly protein